VALLVGSNAAAATDPRIGVMTHFAQGWPTNWADVAAGDLIGSARDELYWAQVETTPGVYSFSAFDAYMAKLKKDAIAPLVIMTFANPLYDGGNTPYTPGGIAAYAKYGVAVLNHFGSQVGALEVWNEFNGTFCTGPATVDREASYTALLKGAYAEVKAVRPDVTVAGGATAGTPLPYWAKLMADGALPYMDVLSIHPYRFDSPPEGIENDVASLRSLMRQYNNGVAKPIWVTEIGWQEQATPLLVDDPTLAKYVARACALLLSAGVDRVYWYLLHDDPGQPMGLYESSTAPKLAAAAMSTLVGELAGIPFDAKEFTPDNVYSLLFRAPGGPQVRVMWSMKSRWTNLLGVTRAVDLQGNSLGVSGNYLLSDSPIFVEGSVTGVPRPSPSDEAILAASAADFTGKQGENGWTYGYVDGSGPFTLMPTYTSNEWNYFWTANFSYLSVTAVDMHPSLDGSTPVNVVRRWTSDRAGLVHIVGNFQGETQGDGVGVSILLDGKPALARHLIGAAFPAAQAFDLVESVSPGSTVDFVVDVGPAADMSYDATNFSVQILTSASSAPSVFPDTGSDAAASAQAAPASGTVLADSVRDFSGIQGGGGWFYGDFASGGADFEAEPFFIGTAWMGRNGTLSIGATKQMPAVVPRGVEEFAAVRRWTSAYSGAVHVVGSFQDTGQGQGVGVTVLLNGTPATFRRLIGAPGAPLTASFDFFATVSPGDTIDFSVDPGTDGTTAGEGPNVTATISVP
jgi:hypothetical protein